MRPLAMLVSRRLLELNERALTVSARAQTGDLAALAELEALAELLGGGHG